MHLDDDALKSKLEANTQFKTLLKENNIKVDPSVDQFKDKMEKEMADEEKQNEDQKKEMDAEDKEYGNPSEKEDTPEETMKQAQR